jgi:hypothetical protein
VICCLRRGTKCLYDMSYASALLTSPKTIVGLLNFIGEMLFALVFGLASATAAEISVHKIPGQTVAIVNLKGEIVAGDAVKFYEAVNRLERATIILQSPGGLVREALQIGAEIRQRNFATMVHADGECYSACGLLWVSGARRYMSHSSRIGFHAAYREENREYKESGVANAEIGSFLTHLGYRIEAIRFFTIAGPNELLLLTPERARVLGIEVYEQKGAEVVTPNQSPVVDVYTDRFVAFQFLKSRCIPFFQPQSLPIDNGARIAFAKGNEMVGADQWAHLMIQRLDHMKHEINSKGALLHCIDVEADLRKQGLSTGIDSPSFSCSAASSPTERAICADETLWAKDRAISAIYLHTRKYNNDEIRKRLLAVQREWLGVRNSCGANTNCLNQIYAQRLRELRGIDIPSGREPQR